MGHRLSKIYTRTGDDGATGLGDGSRTEKDNVRIEAFGAVDELNSQLGVLTAGELPDDIRAFMSSIQHVLFDLGGELSIPGMVTITSVQVAELEAKLDEWNAPLPPLKEFVLPGGCEAAAQCHVVRAVCRRAERRTISLARQQDINPESIRYLNRLSDLLFVAARALNRAAGQPEVLWRRDATAE